MRRIVPRTRFSARDYERLDQMLASKTAVVLAQFWPAQIGCLNELDAYHRLKRTQPKAAAAVLLVATTMGIPEFLPVLAANCPGQQARGSETATIVDSASCAPNPGGPDER